MPGSWGRGSWGTAHRHAAKWGLRGGSVQGTCTRPCASQLYALLFPIIPHAARLHPTGSASPCSCRNGPTSATAAGSAGGIPTWTTTGTLAPSSIATGAATFCATSTPSSLSFWAFCIGPSRVQVWPFASVAPYRARVDLASWRKRTR
eukprot:scaffold5762_cov101-Isochrysis_galbana.AAC.6